MKTTRKIREKGIRVIVKFNVTSFELMRIFDREKHPILFSNEDARIYLSTYTLTVDK